MYYKNFEQHITRKHGIVVEGWPLRIFDNPSAIGSQVELKVLLSSWEAGTTRFRKMSNEEHMAWVENRSESISEPTPVIGSPTTTSPLPLQHIDPGLALAMNPPAPQQPFNIINFGPPSAAPASNDPTGSASKRPRKTRSDKGKPRKKAKASPTPGMNVFHTNALQPA